MSKKAFKSQASSSRITPSFPQSAFSSPANKGLSAGFGGRPASQLAHVHEPPDLSLISDPAVVVCLKNVQKKDSTTKAKALDDLLAFSRELETKQADLDEAVIEAWSKIYPRVSIDNARRVRQAAHTFQGQIAATAGKRIAKHMPTVIGAWACGMNDNDRMVVRAAKSSFQDLFSTTEKSTGAWKAYQTPIINYCSNIIVDESVNSLSDQRTVNKDDAEAKYARVLGAAVFTLTDLMCNLPSEEVQKQYSLWHTLLSQEKLWTNCAFADAFVRRGVYRLLTAILTCSPDLLDYSMVSYSMIYESTRARVSGSAYDFVQALTKLTIAQPAVWTTLYNGTGKKSAGRGLSDLLKQGSYGAVPSYWSVLASLLSAIPEKVLFSSTKDEKPNSQTFQNVDTHFLSALEDGISRKEDGRQDNGAAWDTYLKFSARILSLSNESQYEDICRLQILPLVIQYIAPSGDMSRWTISSDHRKLCSQAILLACQYHTAATENTLQQLSNTIVDRLRTSLPEQSKDYAVSQNTIIEHAQRWYRFLNDVLNLSQTHSLEEEAFRSVEKEQDAAIEILRNRVGKPYAAAAVLDIQCQCLKTRILDKESYRTRLLHFAENEMPKLIATPAAPFLLRVLELLTATTDVYQIYGKCLEILDNELKLTDKYQALEVLITSTWPKYEPARNKLKSMVKQSLEAALSGQAEAWDVVRLSLRNENTPSDLTEDILSNLVSNLSVEEKSPASLTGIQSAVHENASVVRAYLSSEQGANLMSKLLSLSQHPEDEDIRAQATRLKTTTDRLISGDASLSATVSFAEVVRSRTLEAGMTSVSIAALVVQAKELLENTAAESRTQMATNLLLCEEDLAALLTYICQYSPATSLSLTNDLSGAVFLVKQHVVSEEQEVQAYDREGLTTFIRAVIYCLGLLQVDQIQDSTTMEEHVAIARFLAISSQIIADHLNVMTYPTLWTDIASQDLDVTTSIRDLQSDLDGWLSRTSISQPSFYRKLITQLFENAIEQDTLGYYHARAFSALVCVEHVHHDHEISITDDSHLRSMRDCKCVIQSVSYLTTIFESAALLKVCSELMSDLSGTDFDKEQRRGLERLVLLNAVFSILDERKEDLPQQRLVFFIKHIASILQEDTNSYLLTETFKILGQVLPLVKELYGQFWEEILSSVVRNLSMCKDDIPLTYAALHLIDGLHSLTRGDVSEDLEESWKEQQNVLASAVANQLMFQADRDGTANRPLEMVHELLARQIARSRIEFDGSLSELYPLLRSPSVSIQKAAYSVFAIRIPAQQEKDSFDAALSKEYTIALPDELLLLLNRVPPVELLFERNLTHLPSSILSYLLSWKVVFLHWENSSYSLQSVYVDTLKDTSHLATLLALIFDVLITQRSPKFIFDVTKIGSSLDTYSTFTDDNPQAEIEHLLVHLYYLALIHLPQLTKRWWRNMCPRALEKRVEEWTEKHFSPLVIAAELATVSKWEPNPDSTTSLEVSVSPRAREVTARYPIDEQHMAIRIVLPVAYPLHPAAVTTQARVGVDERRWASWLNTSAIAINFASSSQGLGCVVDGLVAWRRNITGALKGQSECAICYSVVSADRQLPGKRCGTCKNMFHGSCLFRWFKSSSSSSCPLCRNSFNYA